MILSEYSVVLYFLPVIPVAIIIYLIIVMRGENSEPVISEEKQTDVVEVIPSDEVEAKPIKDVGQVKSGVALLDSGELDDAEKVFQELLDNAADLEDLAGQCEARYFLAKVNMAMGDLTLACEHWQIARELYKAAGETDRVKEIEKDMRKNGCPTDWVLNGF